MIYSREHGYAYIAPQKTGSISMSTWLREHAGGQVYKKHHTREWPDDFTPSLVFITVRNPYERMRSLWQYRTRPNATPGKREKPGTTFADMCLRYNRLGWGMAAVYRTINAHQFIRVEHIAKDLHKLPFYTGQPYPHANRGPDRVELTASERETVRVLFADDFEMFGYAR